MNMMPKGSYLIYFSLWIVFERYFVDFCYTYLSVSCLQMNAYWCELKNVLIVKHKFTFLADQYFLLHIFDVSFLIKLKDAAYVSAYRMLNLLSYYHNP